MGQQSFIHGSYNGSTLDSKPKDGSSILSPCAKVSMSMVANRFESCRVQKCISMAEGCMHPMMSGSIPEHTYVFMLSSGGKSGFNSRSKRTPILGSIRTSMHPYMKVQVLPSTPFHGVISLDSETQVCGT